MIAAQSAIDRDAGNHADCQPDQDLRVQRNAFRLIRRHLVQIGCYLAFERVALESFWFVVFFRHVFELATPTQLIAQNVEIVSIHWLNEIESRTTFTNRDAILNFQREPDLPIERQCYFFVVSLQ